MFVCRNCKCVYMSRRSWFYVCMFFLNVYSGMYVYMSERVYVFMYLYAYKTDEREREREREREISPWRAIELPRRLLLLVSTIPILLYLANRF